MKKILMLSLVLIMFTMGQAQATDLRALNVQNAKMYDDVDQNAELRVNFDWFGHDGSLSGGVKQNTHTFNMPRIDIRQACTDCPIPFRVGINTSLNAGMTELARNNVETFERSALGFGNLGLTLEAGLVQGDDVSLNWYINQHFALLHNHLLNTLTLRPQNGRNAYGFQTGFLYQVDLAENLTWYGDIGYRFDVFEVGEVENSLVYYNEAVLGLGDSFGLALGLLGNTVYNNNWGTDLRIVPGLVAKVGDAGQFRVGMPLGINGTSPDIGVQVGYFSAF